MKRGRPRGTITGSLEALPEPRTLTIADLVRAGYQVRARLDEAAVSRYANVLVAEGCSMPPIKVALVNGALIVVDGHHRVAAHEARGRTVIEAVVVEATASAAHWMAVVANLGHGVPLKSKELRTALKALIRARQHIAGPGGLLSYRELARKLNGAVRHTTVRNWIKKDHPRLFKQMGSDAPVRASREVERDDEGVLFNTVTAALATAKANARGVRSAARRDAMMQAAEELVRALQEGQEWALEDVGQGALEEEF